MLTVVPAYEIRRASQSDADLIFHLAEEELGRCPSRARLREIVSRYPALVVEISSGIIGFAYGTQMAPDILELGNMLVAKDFRKRGIGSALLIAFEEVARENYDCIVLSNSDLWPVRRPPKISAVPFYEKAGYETILTTSESTILAKRINGGSS